MQQVKGFSNGGFVVHGITGAHQGKVSAWFDPAGLLIDAEQVLGRASRPVKHGGPIWATLQGKAAFYRAMLPRDGEG